MLETLDRVYITRGLGYKIVGRVIFGLFATTYVINISMRFKGRERSACLYIGVSYQQCLKILPPYMIQYTYFNPLLYQVLIHDLFSYR